MKSENTTDDSIERGLTRVFSFVGAFLLACVAGAAYAVLRLIQGL